jgi:hypothetical protein
MSSPVSISPGGPIAPCFPADHPARTHIMSAASSLKEAALGIRSLNVTRPQLMEANARCMPVAERFEAKAQKLLDLLSNHVPKEVNEVCCIVSGCEIARELESSSNLAGLDYFTADCIKAAKESLNQVYIE